MKGADFEEMPGRHLFENKTPKGRFYKECGGDMASTPVAKPDVHAERVVTLVNQSL